MKTREDWTKFLITLPDLAFFSLARHYLGELETPFTKHRILLQLEAKLALPEWKAALREYLSDEDLDVLTAIRVLGEPPMAQVGAFLSWEPGPLQTRIFNLQERLLIYSKDQRLILSPLVTEDPELWDQLDPQRLYAAIEAPAVTDQAPLLHEGTLLALLSFLLEMPLERTATGTWKKRPRQEFLTRFAALGDDREGPRSDRLLQAAERLGLVLWQDGKTVIVWSYWDDFRSLPRAGRLALLWLAGTYSHQTVLFEAARWLPPLLASLPEGRAFPITTLIRLSAPFPALGSPSDRASLFQSWISWGLLIPGPLADTWLPCQALRQPDQVPSSAWVQANFELRLPNDLDFARAWPAALSGRLIRWDRTIHWELEKNATKRAFARGLDAAGLITVLQDLTGVPLTQNLRVSIQEWEGEFLSLRLWKGAILAVSEDRRHLVEHTAGFEKAVIRALAPGIWLVREALLDDWSRELEQRGLPPLPQPVSEGSEATWGQPWSFSGWRLESPIPGEAVVLAPPPPQQSSGNPIRVKDLLQELEARGFPADEKEEWKARILRRLVLSPTQLAHPLGRGERLEAKGLDYAGKVRLVEQALASPADLLEVTVRTETGVSAQWLIRPQRLEKKTAEAVVFAEILETRQAVQLMISRLSQVKKIRGSLLF